MTEPIPTASDVIRQPSVALFLGSMTAVTMGIASQVTALGKLVFDITGRELDLGWLGLAEFLPAAVLAVVAGSLADRVDRRRIGAIGLVVESATAVALAFMASRGPTAVLPILGVVVVFGTARAFAAPAVRALITNLVEPRSLPAVIALNSLSWQAGLIIGPVAGGLLYTVGVIWPFLFTAACSLIGALGLLAVRLRVVPEPPPAPAPSARVGGDPVEVAPTRRQRRSASWREAIEGLRIIRGTPVLLGAISLDLFAVLFGGAVALLPAVAEKRLGVGAAGLGWLRAAGGMGAACTTTVLAARPLRRRVGTTLFVAVGIFGVATIALGLTTSFAVAFASLFVLSAADAVSVFIRASIVPLITPDALRGRVLAVENVFIGASNELGAFESGLVGQWLGAAGAIVTGGAATLIVVGLWAVIFPGIRRINRFEDIEPVQISASIGASPVASAE